MPGAELRLLANAAHIARGDTALDLGGRIAGDDHRASWMQCRAGVQHMQQQGAACKPVQHLGQG